MRTDLKIGIAVGLFVAVIVVVYFVFGSGSSAPLAQPDNPLEIALTEEHNRPEKIEPGESTVQVNVTSALRAGELNLRRGLRELVFDPE